MNITADTIQKEFVREGEEGEGVPCALCSKTLVYDVAVCNKCLKDELENRIQDGILEAAFKVDPHLSFQYWVTFQKDGFSIRVNENLLQLRGLWLDDERFQELVEFFTRNTQEAL